MSTQSHRAATRISHPVPRGGTRAAAPQAGTRATAPQAGTRAIAPAAGSRLHCDPMAGTRAN